MLHIILYMCREKHCESSSWLGNSTRWFVVHEHVNIHILQSLLWDYVRQCVKSIKYSFIQSRISIKKHCQASMVEGLAPPTRAVVHSHDTICRRLRIQYVFLHMCGVNQFWIIVFFAAVKPANNILFCIELIQRLQSSLRRHKLGLTDQSIRSNDDKTRFACVHRLMTTGHSQNICRKVPDDVVLHIWQFKFDCSLILNLL